MDGPNLTAQKLMQSPRQNRVELEKALCYKGSPVTRPETLAVLDLK